MVESISVPRPLTLSHVSTREEPSVVQSGLIRILKKKIKVSHKLKTFLLKSFSSKYRVVHTSQDDISMERLSVWDVLQQ